MTETLERTYGLYYPDSKEWFTNHKQQVFVMRLSDANHIRRVLGKDSPEQIVIRKYPKKDSVIYDGPLLEFER